MPRGVYVRTEETKRKIGIALTGRKLSEEHKKNLSKHGHSKRGLRTKTHMVWSSLLQRCHNSNDPGYKNYGGRGISVCQRWRKFENFLADMGERSAGLMIDRINNDGNYSPGNCRWTDKTTSNRNRRSTKLSVEKANEIRRLYLGGHLQYQIAKMFNVARRSIYKVINNKTWNEYEARKKSQRRPGK